jgi:hypothetical protein
MINVTLSSMLSCIDRLPESPFKSFHQWVLADAPNTIRNDWLQSVGWSQLSTLANYLFKGLLEDHDQEDRASDALGPLQTFAVYATASDALEEKPKTPSGPLAYRILFQFNECMIKTLEGDHEGGTSILEQLRAPCRQLPFEYCRLFPKPLLNAAVGHVRDIENIEQDAVWLMLHAHRHASFGIINRAVTSPLSAAIRDGICAGYPANNTIISRYPDDLSVALEVSTHSILVAPALAAYLMAWLEATSSTAALNSAAVNDALHDAALLTRLLNDLGPLVTVDEATQHKISEALKNSSKDTLRAAIAHDLQPWSSLLTRLRRDMECGESNLLLQHMVERPVREVQDEFVNRIAHFVRTYHTVARQMKNALETLAQDVRSPGPSTIINRFVQFHVMLYGRPHDTLEGEYGARS